MKIAVVGCGAVGSFYGARLCRAGHEVHCLLRSDYDAVATHGLRILSPDGDFVVRPHAHQSPADIGPADLVLVALKTTANHELPRLLPPITAPHTLFLGLQNGLGDEEQIAAVVGKDRVLGGLCFVCLNRIAPGVVRHTAHGLIILGEHDRQPLPRTDALAKLLQEAGIPCRVTSNLARSHWEKLVWNIPFNGLGVAGAAGWDDLATARLGPIAPLGRTLATDQLLDNSGWERRVRELMVEVIETARALGHPLDPALADEQIARTRIMGAYKASTLVDFEQGKPLELESLFLEPLRQARAAGVSTPCLDLLCQILSRLDQTPAWARCVSRNPSP
jgi:2-dehydropantoate 2-reductase